MALWVCRTCTAKYSVDAPRCPQCGADDHFEDGTQPAEEEEDPEMPKITVHGGATNAADLPAVSVAVDGGDQCPAVVEEFTVEPSFEPLPEAVEGDTTRHVAEPDYEGWTVKQLREALANRQPPLPTDGLKAELVARLKDAEGSDG
jgi:hypothetical protein